MKLNNDVLRHTVEQINQMQDAMREAAKQIEGSREYIEAQMAIFRKNAALKNAQKMLEEQREMVANSFFGNNVSIQNAVEEIKKIQVPQFETDASIRNSSKTATKKDSESE